MSFLGRFQLVTKLATGGMADVFRALQWGDGGFVREVVIKRLHRHLLDDADSVSRFQAEARIMSSLTHPGFPQVHDFRREDDAWMMAMEYIAGPNLRELREAEDRTGRDMPLQVALSIVVQACNALHHAHELRDRRGGAVGIVHGDLTPDNVLLTRDGVVKIIDFGVAVTASEDTQPAGLRGTIRYMAPEQARADGLVDRRADVYALGILLFELTTGTALREGDDVQVLTQVGQGTVTSPTTRRADYPPDLAEIALGALSLDPQQRPPTAAALGQAIEGFAWDRGIAVGIRPVAEFVRALHELPAPLAIDPTAPPDFVDMTLPEASAPAADEPPPSSPPIVGDDEHDEMLDDLEMLAPSAASEPPPRGSGPDPRRAAHAQSYRVPRPGSVIPGDPARDSVRMPAPGPISDGSPPPPPAPEAQERERPSLRDSTPGIYIQKPDDDPGESVFRARRVRSVRVAKSRGGGDD